MDVEKINIYFGAECEKNDGNCEKCNLKKECDQLGSKKNEVYAGENNSYTINGKNLNSIKGIEALNKTECEALRAILIDSSLEIIKGHEVYFIDLGGYFGYSALVFLNGKHLYYADDFQLHHKMIFTYNGDDVQQTPHTPETLKKYYMDEMQNKLFALDELTRADGYNEYKKKDYYLRNYWIMQFDRLSAFYISGTDAEKHFNRVKHLYKYYNNVSFCYMNDEAICNKSQELAEALYKSYKDFLTVPDRFREAIRYELDNHEACITMEYGDALAALGLRYSKLEPWQQAIVNNELNNCIERYNV